MISEPSVVWEILHSQHDSLFADKVMKEDDWSRLRKATYRHRLQPVKLARVMFGYFWLLVYVALLSVAVGIYSDTLVQRYNWPMLSLQSVQTFFSATTFALTLLLVFKTNSSYARWWEARKDVGQLVSWAHNIVRQAVAYFPDQQAQLIHAVARYASAALFVVKAMVRPPVEADNGTAGAAARHTAELRAELMRVLLPHELDWLLAQPNRPLALGQALSSIIAAADVDAMVKLRLDQMMTLYTFEFGACGRIYNTAIPFCYTRHTSRFLMCYLTLMPLLLWPMSGWASPLLSVVIAFLLLGVENIGAFIEEPFHIIALDRFCHAVHRDIRNIIAMHNSSGIAGSSVSNVPVVGGLNAPGHLGQIRISSESMQQQQQRAAGDTSNHSDASRKLASIHIAAHCLHCGKEDPQQPSNSTAAAATLKPAYSPTALNIVHAGCCAAATADRTAAEQVPGGSASAVSSRTSMPSACISSNASQHCCSGSSHGGTANSLTTAHVLNDQQQSQLQQVKHRHWQ